MATVKVVTNNNTSKIRDEKIIASISSIKNKMDNDTRGESMSFDPRVVVREHEDIAFGCLDFFLSDDKQVAKRRREFFKM